MRGDTEGNDIFCMLGGTMTYRDDEYGWDGDYEVYDCTCEKRRHYVELPG